MIATTNPINITSRPPEGWQERIDGNLTFVKHDASFFDQAPEREGFKAYFVGRHGVGPGSYTRWTYKPVETPKEA